MKKASRIITFCGIFLFIALAVFSYLYWNTTITWPKCNDIDDLKEYFPPESDLWFPENEAWHFDSRSTYELYTMERITRRTSPSGYIVTSTCILDGRECTLRVFFQFSTSSNDNTLGQIHETDHGYSASIYHSPGLYSLSVSFSDPPESTTEAFLWIEDQIRSIVQPG